MDDSLNESSVSAISRDSGLSTSIADDIALSECSESEPKPHVFESDDATIFQEQDSFIHVNDVDNLSLSNYMKPSVVQELFPLSKENVQESDGLQIQEAEEDCQETVRFRFLVLYLGVTTLDRRYQPSDTVMPWIMSEVKRQQEFQEITIEVLPNKLRAISCNENGTETIFEHGLKGIFKFSKTHQDPRCFGYITRQKLGSDFDCHVFLTHEEKTVKEIFSCIRDATREAAKDPSDLDEMGESKDATFASYEVMYVGKVKVSSKKITSDYLDDLVTRLQEKEISHFKQQHQEEVNQRSRHASGASVKSLPGNLETSVSVMENELGKRQHGADADSTGSSLDDLGSAETLESSSECLIGNTAKDSDSNEDLCNVNSTNNNCHFKSAIAHKMPWKENSRAMLFRLGKNEISLISLDKKQIILERQFKDISFVSQGNNKQDIFAFIARDEKNIFLCHILRCHCGSLVDEIMTSLRMAFNSAFQENRQPSHQMCSDCPLQQFQRLCQDISGLTSQSAHEVIKQKLQKLSEKDMSEISMKLKIHNPQSHDEIVEVLMIALRRLCEAKQCEHLHISDTNRLSRPEFHLMDLKGRASAFDSFRNKAKKSLTNSFENLLLRGRKRDEAREAFRQRSGTSDSEGSWAGRSLDSSATSTPDCSPLPSPVTKEFRYQLPTPPHSPEAGRPRSSTLGSLPGVIKKLEKEEKRLSDAKTDTHSNSPMKQMFLMVGSSGSGSKVTGSMTSPSHSHAETTKCVTPRRSNSWRQAIFNSVVTPVRASNSAHKGEDTVDGVPKTKLTSQELRNYWKKAIMETLLLIRMEKENQSLRARQDEVDTKRKKLDYQEITPCLKDVTKTWDLMLQSKSRGSVCFDPRVLLSAVKQGVPRSKRGDIWRLLVEQHKVNLDEPDAKSDVSYEDLLKQLTTHQHAILIDLGRTFPGHPYFSTQLGPGQLALFNILKAYSLLDNEVGYCQGLSFVAGILLMHMEEAEAFEMIRYMMFNMSLRKRYLPNMMALQIQLYQLTRLLYDHYQDLHNHLDAYEIAPTLYAAPWFLTLFASQFPLGFVARVFDLILQQGPDVIFKIAIVLLGNHKELIMQCDSFESIVEFLKTTLPEMGIIQMERIINQAFQLDISSQLQAYEVEYHVLKEEMLFSPKPHAESELVLTNRALQQQNIEIIADLQLAHSQLRSQEGLIHKLQESECKLKSHIQTLEIERNALLNALSKSQTLLSEDDLENSNLALPASLSALPSARSTTAQRQSVSSNSEKTKRDASVQNNNSISSHTTRKNYNRKS